MKSKILYIQLPFFFIFFLFLFHCKKRDYNIIFFNFSQNSFKIDDLPWGISYKDIQVSDKQFKTLLDNEKIEFSLTIKDENVNNNTNLQDLPGNFQITCYYSQETCKIFKIRKMGTKKELNKFYKNFLLINNINIDKHKKQERKIIKQSQTGNEIIETYKLFDLENYIVQVFDYEYSFSDYIKNKQQKITESDLEIEFMIFSKALNPELNIDYFLKR